MSTQLRAGPVSYLVLGIVAVRGPSTPYDLKRFVQLSIGPFWPFPHTQLYAEPARLAEAGWLDEPVTSPMEYRDLGLLKLFFAELSGPEQVEALALQQAEAQRRQLAEYEAIQERFAGRPELAHRLRSLDLGTRMARAGAEFWEDVAREPNGTGHRRNGR